MRFYSGVVNDNDDPEQLGRLKVTIPEVFDDKPFWDWIRPWGAASGPGAAALWWVPPRGAIVVVVEAAPSVYYWAGAVIGGVNTPPQVFLEDYPNTAGITSPAGSHYLSLNDAAGVKLVSADEVTVEGTQVTLGASTADVGRADRISAALTTLANAISAAPVVAGDGGASFKGALVGALSSWPPNLGCDRVKGD